MKSSNFLSKISKYGNYELIILKNELIILESSRLFFSIINSEVDNTGFREVWFFISNQFYFFLNIIYYADLLLLKTMLPRNALLIKLSKLMFRLKTKGTKG